MLKLQLAEVFCTRTHDEWCALLEGPDACFAPVLDWDEAPEFDRTPSAAPHASAVPTPDAVRARWQAAD